jgi:hypothetical protein
MPALSLTLLNGTFAIHQLPANAPTPEIASDSHFCAIIKTDEEVSLILPDHVRVQDSKSDRNWSCYKVDGELDLSLVGILADLAAVLAKAQVPIFALSTFNTDYILVKQEKVALAEAALLSAGYRVSKAASN